MKFILEILPLAAFFITYQKFGLMTATMVLMGATAISLVVLYIKERKLALNPLISAILIGIFGGLTLFLDDPIFIKMKPTIINILFSLILISGVIMGKPPLKYLMGVAMQLTDRGWRVLSIRWGIFFFALAILNEYIWRVYPEEFWVNFKVFGMLPLTILFLLTQMPLIQREMIANSEDFKEN